MALSFPARLSFLWAVSNKAVCWLDKEPRGDPVHPKGGCTFPRRNETVPVATIFTSGK